MGQIAAPFGNQYEWTFNDLSYISCGPEERRTVSRVTTPHNNRDNRGVRK